MSELTIDTTITYSNQDNTPTRVTHHIGGTRSGKTYALLQWVIVKSLESKQEVTIVRKTIPSLKRTIMKDFKDIMLSLGIWNDNDFNMSDRVYTFYNDSTIQFISTDDAEKLRGLKSSILWLEEANEIDEESYFQLQIRTTGPIILSYNPTISPYHWIRQQQDCTRYFTTYKNNPYLEESVKRAIEELRTANPKAWKVYGLGEYVGNERAIFDFEQCDWVPDDADFVCMGMDFGFAQDPTAIVSLFRNGNNIYLVENCYEKGMVTTEIADKLRGVVGDNRWEIWCDSADPRMIEELYRMGFNTKPVIKGKDSIRFGIQVLQNYKIFIPKTCQNLINEFYSYQWAMDKHQHVTDTPEGGMDHLIDAARYAAMMRLSNVATAKGKYVIRIK
jgi:phage terminase large subunit